MYVKEGDYLNPGYVFGTVFESELFPDHKIMVPPKCKGRVSFIAPPGHYNIHEKVL